jgi:hypothetical protein
MGGLSDDWLRAVIGHMKYGSIGWNPGGVDPDWQVVNGEDVRRAIIEPVATDKSK